MKRTPLPSHTWGDPDYRGDHHCQTDGCGTVWRAEYDESPPWPCRRKSKLQTSSTAARKFKNQRSSLSPVAEGGRKNRRDPKTGVKHTYGPVWEWISKNLPCCVCGTLDGAPADHWKTVGSGGKDPGNLLPICADHSGRHDMGRETWATTHRINPVETAMEAWRAFRRAQPELAENLEDHLPETTRDRAQLRKASG